MAARAYHVGHGTEAALACFIALLTYYTHKMYALLRCYMLLGQALIKSKFEFFYSVKKKPFTRYLLPHSSPLTLVCMYLLMFRKLV